LKRFFQFLSLLFLFLLVFEFSRLYFLIYGQTEAESNLLTVFAITAFKGFFLDLSSAAYCAAPFLLLFVVESLINKKLNPWFYYAILGIELFAIGAITIADPELYRQWGSRFNNQVLVYVSHPLEMAISSGATQWGKTIPMSLVLILVLVVFGRWIFKLAAQKIEYSKHQLISLIVCSLLSFLFMRGGVGVTTISQSSAIFSNKRFYNATAINGFWNALYYMVYRVDQIYDKKYFPFDSKLLEKEIVNQFQNSDSIPDLTEQKDVNMIVVLLESFTAGASQYFTDSNNLTPNLDRIAKSSLSFKQCYASGNRTDKGIVSVMSGYPAQPASSIIVFPDKMAKLPSMVKGFVDKGYTSDFYYGGDADFASMKAYMLMQGFQNIVDKSNFEKKELNSKWGAHDENLYKKFLDQKKGQKTPFFSVLLTLSSHEPYEVSKDYQIEDKGEWKPFKNSIMYADECLNEFIEACKKQDWYKNTLIVLVADHGHDIGLQNVLFFGKEKFHIPLVVTGGALNEKLRGLAIHSVVSQTIVPKLILSSLEMNSDEFNWQSGTMGSNSFAQYHYNSGFGRVSNQNFYLFDNYEKTFFYQGNSTDSAKTKRKGMMFQQMVVEDFMKK
jgi:phosphoglycerol transferase MdoB-like AlkP superfamily enzyme